jgi:hypothetical protein
MGSLKRKMSRNKAKQAKKDLKQKMGMFDKLQDECLVCEAPFDKKSKEHVQTWFITIREKQNTVNLYCPECWGTAQRVIENYGKGEQE